MDNHVIASAADLHAEAANLVNLNQIDLAQKVYQTIIHQYPSDAEARFSLGVLLYKNKAIAHALAYFDDAIKLNQTHAESYCYKGNCLYMSGKLEQALDNFKHAVRLKPDYAEALCNMGSSYGSLGQYDLALEYFHLAQTADPNYAKAFYNCAVALTSLGRHQEAILQYRKTVALYPEHSNAWLTCGIHLAFLKEFDEAALCYKKCLALNSEHAEAYFNLGVIQSEQKHYPEAIQYYSKAIDLSPNYSEALVNRGEANASLLHHEEALRDFYRARDIQPSSEKIWCAIANTHKALNQLDLAIEGYTRAIALNPTYLDAINNRSIVYLDLFEYGKAIEDMEFYVSIKPQESKLYNLGFYKLLVGDLLRGFELYEHRAKSDKDIEMLNGLNCPLWDGDADLQGKHIAVIMEQGFGDVIQFSRYAKNLIALGAKVSLLVSKPLVNLLRTLDENIRVVSGPSKHDNYDYKMLLMSAAHLFKTTLETIPSAHKYYYADQAKVILWNKRLPPKTKLRVGLAWSGNPKHLNDKNRSLSLEHYLTMLPEGFDYICLQKEIRESDRELMREIGFIQDVSQYLNDFGETAALCESVDLVLSVDTSVVHLAASLGKPTWIIVSKQQDWRWLLDREDSPWYPTVRLFRQQDEHDWANVFEEVRAALKSFPKVDSH